MVQELRNAAAEQFLTITDPERFQTPGAGVICIQSWKGMAFDVQASADPDQWSPLTTVTNLTGTLEFMDPDAAAPLRRFCLTVVR